MVTPLNLPWLGVVVLPPLAPAAKFFDLIQSVAFFFTTATRKSIVDAPLDSSAKSVGETQVLSQP
jgi:hypothetical protein